MHSSNGRRVLIGVGGLASKMPQTHSNLAIAFKINGWTGWTDKMKNCEHQTKLHCLTLDMLVCSAHILDLIASRLPRFLAVPANPTMYMYLVAETKDHMQMHRNRIRTTPRCENNLLQMLSPDAEQFGRFASVRHQQQFWVDHSRSVNDSWQVCIPAQHSHAFNDLQ